MRFVFILFCTIFAGCYSFRGISIDPNIKTFTVRTFENGAPTAPPTLAVDFSQRLIDKIRTETPLKYQPDEADAEFSGKVSDYRVVPVAPKPGETVALNRLELRFRITYTINKEGIEAPWKGERDFGFFYEFSNTADLLSIQDTAIREISKQILEDIFNAAFNNW